MSYFSSDLDFYPMNLSGMFSDDEDEIGIFHKMNCSRSEKGNKSMKPDTNRNSVVLKNMECSAKDKTNNLSVDVDDSAMSIYADSDDGILFDDVEVDENTEDIFRKNPPETVSTEKFENKEEKTHTKKLNVSSSPTRQIACVTNKSFNNVNENVSNRRRKPLLSNEHHRTEKFERSFQEKRKPHSGHKRRNHQPWHGVRQPSKETHSQRSVPLPRMPLSRPRARSRFSSINQQRYQNIGVFDRHNTLENWQHSNAPQHSVPHSDPADGLRFQQPSGLIDHSNTYDRNNFILDNSEVPFSFDYNSKGIPRQSSVSQISNKMLRGSNTTPTQQFCNYYREGRMCRNQSRSHLDGSSPGSQNDIIESITGCRHSTDGSSSCEAGQKGNSQDRSAYAGCRAANTEICKASVADIVSSSRERLPSTGKSLQSHERTHTDVLQLSSLSLQWSSNTSDACDRGQSSELDPWKTNFEGFLRKGKIDDALAIVIEVKETVGHVDFTYLENLLVACQTVKDGNEVYVALKAFEMLKEERGRLVPMDFKYLILVFCAAGRLAQAVEYIERMKTYVFEKWPGINETVENALCSVLQCFIETASCDVTENSKHIFHLWDDLETHKLLKLRLIDDLLSIESSRRIIFDKLTPNGVLVLHKKIIKDKYELKPTSKEQLMRLLFEVEGPEYLLDFFLQYQHTSISVELLRNIVNNSKTAAILKKLLKLLPQIDAPTLGKLNAETWTNLFTCCVDEELDQCALRVYDLMNTVGIQINEKCAALALKLKLKLKSGPSIVDLLQNTDMAFLFNSDSVDSLSEIFNCLTGGDLSQLVSTLILRVQSKEKIKEKSLEELVAVLAEHDMYSDMHRLLMELHKMGCIFSFHFYMKVKNCLEEWEENPDAAVDIYSIIRRSYKHKRTALYYHGYPLSTSMPLRTRNEATMKERVSATADYASVPSVGQLSTATVRRKKCTTPGHMQVYTDDKMLASEDNKLPATPDGSPPSEYQDLLEAEDLSHTSHTPQNQFILASPASDMDVERGRVSREEITDVSAFIFSPESGSGSLSLRQDSGYGSASIGSKSNDKVSPQDLPEETTLNQSQESRISYEVDWFISFRVNGLDDHESNMECSERLYRIFQIGNRPSKSFEDFTSQLRKQIKGEIDHIWKECSTTDSGLTPKDEVFFGRLGVKLVQHCYAAEQYIEAYQILHTLHSLGLNYSFTSDTLSQADVLALACNVCLKLSPPQPLGAVEVLRGSNYALPLRGTLSDADMNTRMVTFGSVLRSLLNSNNLEEVQELFEKYHYFDSKPLLHCSSLANELLIKLCSRNMIDKASSLFNQMENNFIARTDDSFRAYLNCCALSGKYLKARQLFFSGCIQGIYQKTFAGMTPEECCLTTDLTSVELTFIVETHINGLASSREDRDLSPYNSGKAEDKDLRVLTFIFTNSHGDEELQAAKTRLVKALTVDMNPPLTIVEVSSLPNEVKVDMLSVSRWLRAVPSGSRHRHNIYGQPTTAIQGGASNYSVEGVPYLQPGMMVEDDRPNSVSDTKDIREVNIQQSSESSQSSEKTEYFSRQCSSANHKKRIHIARVIRKELTRFLRKGYIKEKNFKDCARTLLHKFLDKQKNPLEFNETVKVTAQRFVRDFVNTSGGFT